MELETLLKQAHSNIITHKTLNVNFIVNHFVVLINSVRAEYTSFII